jgi:hypothetical protein
MVAQPLYRSGDGVPISAHDDIAYQLAGFVALQDHILARMLRIVLRERLQGCGRFFLLIEGLNQAP